MATYLTLSNRVLESLNEVTVSTTDSGTEFDASRGIQTAVKTFINQSIYDILKHVIKMNIWISFIFQFYNYINPNIYLFF